MYKVGIIFLYNKFHNLKPYSNKNKINYEKKILIHQFTYLLNKDEDIFIYDVDKKITMKNISNFIYTFLNLDKKNIIDYNPIYKLNKNSNISYFVILLNNKYEDNIKNKLGNINNKKLFTNNMILFYTLNFIKQDKDICKAILDYNLYSSSEKKGKIFKNDKIFIEFNQILKSLYGLISIDESIKTYI